MYTTRNFKSKKLLKEAVQQYTLHKNDEEFLAPAVTLFAPGLGSPKENGTEYVEGPHYPAPHTWYATVTVENGIVVKVK